MKDKSSALRFAAPLRLPDELGATWAFVHVPRATSLRLSTRGQVPVAGSVNGRSFRGVLEPDGSKGHWLKIPATLKRNAGATAGQVVAVEVVLSDHEPTVPADVRRALTGSPAARSVWKSLTPAARRDWIHWISSAKKAETRARRIESCCDMLGTGKRRVCCFDRSGAYSKSLSAPRTRSRIPGAS